MDAASAWKALDEPWQACLSLAWSAYGAGTIPVGAALVDAAGAIVTEGRDRVYERDAPPGQIANSPLAHAEVNALVGLDPERRYRRSVSARVKPASRSVARSINASTRSVPASIFATPSASRWSVHHAVR